MAARDGTGLFQKYVVRRRVGDLMLTFDPGEEVPYPTFVLRIDGEDPAAMEALRAYAMATDDLDLASIVDRLAMPAATTAVLRRDARNMDEGRPSS